MTNAHVIDNLTGQRIRMRRMLMGMSQKELAAKLGISFQQIQKYEAGTNRISMGKFVLACRHLGVKPADLVANIDAATKPNGKQEATYAPSMAQLNLMGHLRAIDNPEFTAKLAGLAKAIRDSMPAPRRKKKAA